MKRLLVILHFLLLLTYLYSCNSPTKVIYKYKNERVKISFLESPKLNSKKNRYNFYAKVDSAKTRFYFVFYPNQVCKIYENDKNSIYSLTYTNNPKVALTGLDKFVLNFAEVFIDSLGKKDLRFKKGATGFLEEIIRTP